MELITVISQRHSALVCCVCLVALPERLQSFLLRVELEWFHIQRSAQLLMPAEGQY